MKMVTAAMVIDTLDIALCDLDGTLCDHRWREHHAEKAVTAHLTGNKNEENLQWGQYFDLLCADRPHEPILDLIFRLKLTNLTVVFLTARPERYRAATEEWLGRYGFGGHYVIMAPDDLIIAPHVRAKWKREVVGGLAAVQRVHFAIEDHTETADTLRDVVPVLLYKSKK